MKRPPEELVETSRHVLYEVHMLEVTASAIASEVYKGEMLNNALVESFLIHARNLIDFLFSEGRYDTDVLAVHFLDDPDRWESQRGALPEKLNTVRRRASKELTHITLKLLAVLPSLFHDTPPGPRWAFSEVSALAG